MQSCTDFRIRLSPCEFAFAANEHANLKMFGAHSEWSISTESSQELVRRSENIGRIEGDVNDHVKLSDARLAQRAKWDN
jgi:hypothetical protein